MKSKSLKLVVSLLIIMANSCNEPETVVTDIIHPDGSITRKIEMKNSKNNFSVKSVQIPFDSTWTIRDSLEISKKGDTTWVKRADKLFASVDEINMTYKKDTGANRAVVRYAEFRKKFRWFNTDYVFNETIDRNLKFGYPVTDFLNKEELNYFYSPGKLNEQKRNGPDSLKYKALADTVNKKTDLWTKKSLISEWIGEFTSLTPDKTEKELSSESLKSRENEFVKSMDRYSDKFDSLWEHGIILKDFFGETAASKYRTQADSAMAMAIRKAMISFKDYSVRIVMPGKLTGTNGFVDSSHLLIWPVESNYFFTEPYRMWAESKTTNMWAWIVTGFFLAFVAAGLIFRKTRK